MKRRGANQEAAYWTQTGNLSNATHAYIVASKELGNGGPNSPGDVARWVNYSGHEWKEKGVKEWTEANMTVECIKQEHFLDQ